MRMDPKQRASLMGLESTPPPASLTALSQFETSVAYREFLAETLEDPADYWRKVAEDIPFNGNPFLICLDGAPDAPALVVLTPAGDLTTISRAKMYTMVCSVAKSIDAMQLDTGSTLPVRSASGACLLIGTLACLHRGMVPQPLALEAGSHAGPTRVLEVPELPQEASPRPPLNLSPQATGMIFEGLSGQLLSLPLGGFIGQAASSSKYLLDTGVKAQPLWIHCPGRPLSIIAAAIGHLVQGRSLGFLSSAHTSTKASLVSALSTVGATSLMLGISAIASIEDDDVSPEEPTPSCDKLRLIFLEGASARPSHGATVSSRLGAKNAHVVHVLAQPEAGGIIAGPYPLISPVRSGAVSMGAPGVDLCVMDTHAKPCAPGVGGYLSLRAPLPGMARELAAQSPPFTLETRAREDLNRVLWTMGEIAMKPTGANTVPIPQLEAFISELGCVEQVAVVRFSGEGVETRTRAFITPATELTNEELIDSISAAIADKLGAQNVPDSFEMKNQLPRSRSGKLLRSVLRRACEELPVTGDDVAAASRTDAPSTHSRQSGQ